jgi:hypothetical protein
MEKLLDKQVSCFAKLFLSQFSYSESFFRAQILSKADLLFELVFFYFLSWFLPFEHDFFFLSKIFYWARCRFAEFGSKLIFTWLIRGVG